MAEPAAAPAEHPVEPNVYFALGVVGAIVFLLGVFRPFLGRLPYGSYLGLAVAAAGGALAVFGFSRWHDARHPPAPTPGAAPDDQTRIRYASSFEVYNPREGEESQAPSGRRGRAPPAP